MPRRKVQWSMHSRPFLASLKVSFFLFFQTQAANFDALILLRHPAQAEKSGEIEVGAVNLINDLSSAASPAPALVRDSLHFGLGLPAGWSVLSVTFYPAFDFRPSRASVNRLDTNHRNQLLRDSLEASAGKGTAMAPDAGLAAYVKGRTYRAKASPESLGTVYLFKADSMPQWLGFSAPLNLSLPAGQPADTVSGSTAIKQIPVFIHLSLKAPDREESLKPVYLGKSGPLDTAAYADPANLDRASLVYRPLAVVGPVSLLTARRGSFRLRADAARDILGRASGTGPRRAPVALFPLR